MDQHELRDIIASARAGDASSYEALLDAYGNRLYGYFVRATGSHHDAEDLLGELTLRLVKRLKSYDEQGRFDQWLFRIAANLVRDRFRRLKTGPTVLSYSAEDSDGKDWSERIGGRSDPAEARLQLDEANEKLQDALGQLEADTRQMILLRYYGQVSFKELADMFNCPMGTALAKVHRGLKTLRKLMGDEYGTE